MYFFAAQLPNLGFPVVEFDVHLRFACVWRCLVEVDDTRTSIWAHDDVPLGDVIVVDAVLVDMDDTIHDIKPD